MHMDDSQVIDTLARTLFGEARGEGKEGMQAIANVVVNRVNSGVTWWGDDIYSVCRKPWQFSCWNTSDPNRVLVLNVNTSNTVFQQCVDLATKAFEDLLDDITNGATSYYSTYMDAPPHWAIGKSPCATIGHALFFKI